MLEIIRQPSLINIDFSDLRAILHGHDQLAFLNSAMAEGEQRLDEILHRIHCYDFYASEPLPPDKLLLHIAGGADLKMAEVNTISQEIKKPNPAAQIIFGVDRRNNFKNRIKVTLLSISGLKDKPTQAKSSPKDKDSENKKERSKKAKPKKAVKSDVQKKPPQKDKKTVATEKKAKKVKRLNALDVKELKQKSEFQKTSQEKIWEIPAFLRRKS